jgi:iron complex transport system ATP-binding protein
MLAARSLVVHALVAGYEGKAPALRGVGVSLLAGSLVGVMGPNGAGKSTFLRAISRLLRPRSGGVAFEGRDLYRSVGEREAARGIALVPQEEPAAFPLTVRELVQLGRTPWLGRFGWLHREDRRAVERAIEGMDLGALADRPVGELSGGERKRAVIARAMAQEARVLLLDEPTAHLDVRHALELFCLLKGLARSGRLVVVASHEMWQLGRFCDRVLLFARGRLVADGAPRRVMAGRACSKAFGVRFRLARVGGAVTPVVL